MPSPLVYTIGRLDTHYFSDIAKMNNLDSFDFVAMFCFADGVHQDDLNVTTNKCLTALFRPTLFRGEGSVTEMTDIYGHCCASMLPTTLEEVQSVLDAHRNRNVNLTVDELHCSGTAWRMTVSVVLTQRDILACDYMLRQVLVDGLQHRPSNEREHLMAAKLTAVLRVRFFGEPNSEVTACNTALAALDNNP